MPSRLLEPPLIPALAEFIYIFTLVPAYSSWMCTSGPRGGCLCTTFGVALRENLRALINLVLPAVKNSES